MILAHADPSHTTQAVPWEIAAIFGVIAILALLAARSRGAKILVIVFTISLLSFGYGYATSATAGNECNHNSSWESIGGNNVDKHLWDWGAGNNHKHKNLQAVGSSQGLTGFHTHVVSCPTTIPVGNDT